MEDTAIPYELPEAENHSFFFIDQRIETGIEAKLHRHDAWELYYVVHGQGNRTAGDTLQPFAAGDVALIPPSMLHRWEYAPDSADSDGCVRYLMVAFSHLLVERCMEAFPELRNRLTNIVFPTDALKFGPESSRVLRKILAGMNAPPVAYRFYVVGSYARRPPDPHRAGCEADTANLGIRHGALRPYYLAERHRCGSGHEPLGVLHLFQAMQGDDLLAVRHAIPLEHRLRTAETLAETGIGNMLYGRVQRPAPFHTGVHERHGHVAVQIPETIRITQDAVPTS